MQKYKSLSDSQRFNLIIFRRGAFILGLAMQIYDKKELIAGLSTQFIFNKNV